MTARTKIRIQIISLAVMVLGSGGYYGWTHWHPLDAQMAALAHTDLANLTDDQVRDFAAKLDISALNNSDRNALLAKFDEWMNKKNLLDRAKFMSDSMAIVQKDPNGPLAKSGNQIMEAMFRKKMKEYAKATPEERAKIIDERVAQQTLMERGQQIAHLFSGSSGSSGSQTPPVQKPSAAAIQQHIGDAIAKSIENGDPDDRAGAAQYFADLRAARIKAGLPTRW